ncbi:class-II fumarase/aspartase family protein [Amycolatopsis sp. CA-230715]|uniref:class-II fumarase/aspartase family protein n=1 Tax=Amycolatopsis sp. CA-230715 TaxID=2745196 RepID=UPI001C0259A8|nr:adenylosuccinate lyase family protein [Amycolatopsis sp. CA-230715]
MTDSGLLGPVWAGTPIEPVVGDEAWLRAMIDAEAALARAQARLGLIPGTAAESITSAASTARLDLRELALRARSAANPVVALVPAFTDAVREIDPDAAEYVHRGSTSQDILDTACMLVAQRALALIETDLTAVANSLAGLAEAHRETVLAGRTLTQHAVPITFALKAATWLQGVLDALARVREVVLPAELGGAAGTLSAYGAYAELDGGSPLPLGGAELIAPFAEETGLAEPVTCWHTARAPIADLGAVAQFVTGALGKLALDVQISCRTEIAELAEPFAAGRGASSAMPQKRNPVLATLILSAARQVPSHALVLSQSMLADDERPGGAWHAEWQSLREALRLTGGATHTAAELCAGLVVYPERMAENLARTGGAIVAERLTVALAPVLGKARAKKLLTDAAIEADSTGKPFASVVAALPELTDLLADGKLLDPREYVGASDALVDRVLARHRAL